MSSSSEQSPKFNNPPPKRPHRLEGDSTSQRQPTSDTQRDKNSRQKSVSDSILLHRPKRPKAPNPEVDDTPPAATTPETSRETQPAATVAPPADELTVEPSAGQQPIPPPSEPMQYRAIGLIKGQYLPSQDQLNRGVLMTEDGTALDAVLLGQVMSLVKKYLDLGRSYLWVVYPRTRDKQETLHTQIVGVWSDEGFGPMAGEAEDQDSTTEQNDKPVSAVNLKEGGLAAPLQDGYFSVRGQVIAQSPDKEFVLVKIQQAPRRSSERPRMFKLKLLGALEGQVMGYFWDFHVQREGSNLVIKQATSVAMVPLKKRKRKKPPVPRKRPSGPASQSTVTSSTPAETSKGSRIVDRPIKRKPHSLEAES